MCWARQSFQSMNLKGHSRDVTPMDCGRGDAEQQVVGHPFVGAHDALGDALGEPTNRSIDIRLGERISPSIDMNAVDPRQIIPELGFEERQRPPSVAPLIGLRPVT